VINFKNIFSINKFSSIDEINNFQLKFNFIETAKETYDFICNIEDINYELHISEISEFIHYLDQLILSLAPFSYKNEAYLMQTKLNYIRNYFDAIPKSKSGIFKYSSEVKNNRKIRENYFLLYETLISKYDESNFPKTNPVNENNKKSAIKSESPQIEKAAVVNDKKALIKKEAAEKDNIGAVPKNQTKKVIETKFEAKPLSIPEDENSNKVVLYEKKEDSVKIQISKETVFSRIEKRNLILQTLLDVYHDKRNGYKLLSGLFRGLDIYRRMCLSGEIFNKTLFMNNFRKYITHFKEANLVELCLIKTNLILKSDLEKMIVDCLKIINKQVDKSRLKLNFTDKLNYRSGFRKEFQEKVNWFYFPNKRRPKRNLDELYTIRSVIDSYERSLSTSKRQSYSQFLSQREVYITNMILNSLVNSYYKRFEVKKQLIKLFYLLDNFEDSYAEMTEQEVIKFKEDFKNYVLNASSSTGSVLRVVIDSNPKISPVDLKMLLPTCVKIMKEKIDLGFERKKRQIHLLSNSFNPLEKYNQIYDRKIFRVYKRV